MLILLKADATPEQQQAVETHIRSLGYTRTSSGCHAHCSGHHRQQGALDPSRSG
jgi:hypothetical protein